MNDKVIIDTNFTEVNTSSTKKYSTIEEVSQFLSIDVPTIIFWCNKFNHILNIQSIGMYQIFNENDIKNLKTIKKLLTEDNMSINEAKQFLNHNKEIIIAKKEIEVPEASLLTVIAKILKGQNEKIETLLDANENLFKINQELASSQKNIKDTMIKFQKEVCLTIENQTAIIKQSQLQETEKISMQEQKYQNEIKGLREEISKLNKTMIAKIDLIEQEATKKDNEMIDMNRQHMEERRKLQEQLEKEKSKGFFSKLFGK